LWRAGFLKERGDKFMFKSRVLMMLGLVLMVVAAASISAPADEATKGSATVIVSNAFFLAGNEIKSGQYDIEWQASASEAGVVFKLYGKTAGEARGKIVMGEKAENHTLLTQKDSSGRVVLKSIQFSGKKVKIVFE
jgi:hypothetical protein